LIVATAPGRCGIVGNPTDIYGGSVLSISTKERARCVLTSSERMRVNSSGDQAIFTRIADLSFSGNKLDVVRAALKYFEIDPDTAHFSLELSSDIPMQAGMAGSTSLTVALVGALDRHFVWNLHPWSIAETARKIEANVLRVFCGLQDQHMAVFGGINYMDFRGKEMLEQRDDEPLVTVEPLAPFVTDIPLLTAHTGVQHHSGTVHSNPRERWLADETLVRETFIRIADLARLGKRALLARDWPELGRLMNENHVLISKLGGSGPANDKLIEAAIDAGAHGAKLAGAGGGGTILVLADNMKQVRSALLAAGSDRIMEPVSSPGLTVTG
jgi:galactokinase/mevalonate kinase-like predicted kinase